MATIKNNTNNTKNENVAAKENAAVAKNVAKNSEKDSLPIIIKKLRALCTDAKFFKKKIASGDTSIDWADMLKKETDEFVGMVLRLTGQEA